MPKASPAFPDPFLKGLRLLKQGQQALLHLRLRQNSIASKDPRDFSGYSLLIYIQCFRGRGACGVRRVGVCPVPGITFICMICSLQGVVCTLHEGDDFGKLALVNDAPRAASIVLREDNCHFLRVDKEDFNRILRVSLRCSVAEGLPVSTFA